MDAKFTKETAAEMARRSHLARKKEKPGEYHLKRLQKRVFRVLFEGDPEVMLRKIKEEKPALFIKLVEMVLPKMGRVEENQKTAEQAGEEAVGEYADELGKWMAEREERRGREEGN